jgi:hypothetical protein
LGVLSKLFDLEMGGTESFPFLSHFFSAAKLFPQFKKPFPQRNKTFPAFLKPFLHF